MQKIYFIVTVIVVMLFCSFMLVERHLLNHSYSKISDVIEEKDQVLQQLQQQHAAEINHLNYKLHLHQQQFHVVMPYRSLETPVQNPAGNENKENAVPLPVLTQHDPGNLTQFHGEKELREEARKLADLAKEQVNAENIIKIFRENLDPQFKRDLFIRTPEQSQQLINIQAALLDALCAELGYRAETVLYWDMNTMEHFFKTTVSSSKDLLDRATLIHGAAVRKDLKNSMVVSQKKPVSIVLPFHPIELSDHDRCVLMSAIHPVPVGGLYLHRIDVNRHPGSRAKEWILEYRFKIPEKEKEEEKATFLPDRRPILQTMLSAVSLIPGAPLLSSVSEGTQSFRIPFVDGKSSVLIVGDLPVLPVGITAYSIVE